MTPASSRSTGGSGLGLSIVKRLVEAMAGEVSCVSDLGRGAKFVVDLPRAPDSEMPVAPHRAPRAFAGPATRGRQCR